MKWWKILLLPGRAEFDKVLLVMRSTKRCQRLTNLFFCEAICTQNRSDWMAACINHLYCIGNTLSTSPQKVFCHRLGNIWLYPSGKVGPRKVFNNPRKLFERYRWMEKSFGLSDEIVHTTKSTTTMAHLNSPLFLGQMMTIVFKDIHWKITCRNIHSLYMVYFFFVAFYNFND